MSRQRPTLAILFWLRRLLTWALGTLLDWVTLGFLRRRRYASARGSPEGLAGPRRASPPAYRRPVGWAP